MRFITSFSIIIQTHFSVWGSLQIKKNINSYHTMHSAAEARELYWCESFSCLTVKLYITHRSTVVPKIVRELNGSEQLLGEWFTCIKPKHQDAHVGPRLQHLQ